MQQQTSFALGSSAPLPDTGRRLCVTLLVVLSLAAFATVAAADDKPPSFVVEEPDLLQVGVEYVHLQSFSSLERLQGKVSVKLSLTNQSDAVLEFTRDSFDATCGGMTSSLSTSAFLPNQRRAVAVGETISGWIAIDVRHPSSTEPDIVLNIKANNETVVVPVNDAIRTTSACRVRKVGPRSLLSVITLRRPTDALAIWILKEKFQSLKNEGVERLVVEFQSQVKQQGQPSSSVANTSVHAWLESASMQVSLRQLPFLTTVQSDVKFDRLFLVQPATSRRIMTPGGADLRRDSVDVAIADALRDVFHTLSPAEVDEAFQSPEAGIRRVALETNIDRLTGEELTAVVTESRDSLEKQKLLASLLYRSPSEQALRLCEDLARSDNPDVSQAALLSIIKSPSRQATSTALRLWREFEGRTAWETDLVNAILKEDDQRFVEILREYAENRLTEHTASGVGAVEQDGDELKPPRDLPKNRRSAESDNQPIPLPEVLRYLKRIQDRNFEDFAIDQFLLIKDPAIQDIVLGFVLESGRVRTGELVRQYIERRLPEKTEPDTGLSDSEQRLFQQRYGRVIGPVGSLRYSAAFFQAVSRYPNPTYTSRLLELTEDKTLGSSQQTNAFMAAMRGATPTQLGEMVKGFEEFDRRRQNQVLTFLAATEWSGWLELAEQSLKSNDQSVVNDTLRLLQGHHSTAAVLLVIRHLDERRIEIEQAYESGEQKPLEGEDRRYLIQLQSARITLRAWSHPEVRRFFNMLQRSPVMEFYQAGSSFLYERASGSPDRATLTNIRELRTAGKNKEAEELCNVILKRNPFQDAALVSLASLCMRGDRPSEAMEHLRRAIELSPADVDTESFIALAMIRLGDVEGGLKKTEATLTSVPDLETPLRTNAIYNAACSYSRATEQVSEEKLKKRYQDKAFEYLREAIRRPKPFTDVAHTLADPDLKPLHKLPDWNATINAMKERAKEVPEP